MFVLTICKELSGTRWHTPENRALTPLYYVDNTYVVTLYCKHIIHNIFLDKSK